MRRVPLLLLPVAASLAACGGPAGSAPDAATEPAGAPTVAADVAPFLTCAGSWTRAHDSVTYGADPAVMAGDWLRPGRSVVVVEPRPDRAPDDETVGVVVVDDATGEGVLEIYGRPFDWLRGHGWRTGNVGGCPGVQQPEPEPAG